MINTIIFDVGGVFINGSFRKFLKKTSEITGTNIEDDSNFRKISKEWMKGNLTFKEFIKKISGKNIQEEKIEKIFKMWINTWKFDHEMISFAKKFKKDYRLIILSNVDSEGVKSREADFLDFFERKFHSFDIGMVKPEREIYEHVLKELNAKPEECVFIDDKVENIEAAKNLGIHGIVFENKEQLKDELEKLGVVE